MGEITTDQYYHQLSSPESYQSIAFMDLSDIDDDDRGSDNTTDSGTSQQIHEETKRLLENPLPYEGMLLPYKPSTSDDELASSIDQLEFDEFDLSPATLELDEFQSQYMLQDEFQTSQYQINKSERRVRALQNQYEEFQDKLEEHSGTALVKDIQHHSGEIHIDLHKAFLKECRNLDFYFKDLEEKEMTKHNVTDMTKYVNKLRDLYMAFLINYIDQKYQLISLQNRVIENKHGHTITNNQQEHTHNNIEIPHPEILPSDIDTPQIEVSEEVSEEFNCSITTTSNEEQTITTTKRVNSRKQVCMTYTRPYVLILKNASHARNTRKTSFNTQKNTIEDELEPKKNSIGIKSIGPTRQGGVVLSFYSENERALAHDILKHKVEKMNLLVTIPTIIYPKMVIHDIGNHWNIRELKTTLIKQNKEIEEACNNGEMFDIVFLSKAGEVVIKVSPLIRDQLKRKGRICANLESYKVSDRVFVKRCYKCHQFGHFSSGCTYKDQKCGHCNESHTLQNCFHKDDQTKAKCVNCMKSKLYKNKANHRPSDPACLSLHHEQQKAINKTDYGYFGY